MKRISIVLFLMGIMAITSKGFANSGWEIEAPIKSEVRNLNEGTIDFSLSIDNANVIFSYDESRKEFTCVVYVVVAGHYIRSVGHSEESFEDACDNAYNYAMSQI